MPKEITHWTLAQKAYQEMDAGSALKPILSRHKHLYLLGAVIADTPFYRLIGKTGKLMNQVGKRIHDNPDNGYEPAVRVINAYSPHPPDDVLALLLGFFAHVHADASFHPFVCHFSGSIVRGDKEERAQATIFHHTLESWLDIYYARESPLQNSGFFSEVLKNVEMEDEPLLKLLAILYSGGEPVEMSCVRETLICHALIQRLFDKRGVNRILELLNRIPGIDADVYRSSFYPLQKPDPSSMFLHPVSYQHPVTGETFQHTLRDLERKTIRDTLEICRLVEHHRNRSSLGEAFAGLKGPSLYTGMTDARESDMRYFNMRKEMAELVFHSDSDIGKKA